VNWSRRKFLQRSFGTAAISDFKLSGRGLLQSPGSNQSDLHNAVSLAKFVDPLPIPQVIRPAAQGSKRIRVRISEFYQKIHRDLPPTRLWGYNAMWPGPTIEVPRGCPLEIEWMNRLPRRHLLPIDPTIHGAEAALPGVRTVTHLHGAVVLPESDGYPEAWFTADGKTGPKFSSSLSSYSNHQPSATLWYHDHCLGITRLNVYAGLAGLYLVRDEVEKGLNLPAGNFEVPLIIQDRSFQPDGSLHYPRAVNGTHPIWVPEFFGETICVNGKATPFLEVEPRKYRFRILNASNSRFYDLRLSLADYSGKVTDNSWNGPLFYQIGSDGGLLPHSVSMFHFVIAPGERFDVIVDFAPYQGKNLVMNSILGNNDDASPMMQQVIAPDVMLFRVNKPLSGPDTTPIPDKLTTVEQFDPAHAVRERILPVTEVRRNSDGYVVTGLLGNARWHEPITEDPKAGSTEIWSFVNTTQDMHPLHIHLGHFRVLDRRKFDLEKYKQTGELSFIGPALRPEPSERLGRKDTVKAYPEYVTRIIQRFDLPPGTSVSPGQEFLYVWHCHVLEHEDNEMMRPYKIVG
jgi:spore coat protein A, manganese oxidase